MIPDQHPVSPTSELEEINAARGEDTSPLHPSLFPAPSPQLMGTSHSILPQEGSDRPWTSHWDLKSKVESTAQKVLAEKDDKSQETVMDKPENVPVERDPVADWVTRMRKKGQNFDQGLVTQPNLDEAGRALETIFPPHRVLGEQITVGNEFEGGEKHLSPLCNGPCHPLCHIRPISATSRSNELSPENPFNGSGWYADIASAHTNLPEIPGHKASQATKLFHMRQGDVLSGRMSPPICPMCRGADVWTGKDPYGEECCAPAWNRLYRFAQYKTHAFTGLHQDSGDPQKTTGGP